MVLFEVMNQLLIWVGPSGFFVIAVVRMLVEKRWACAAVRRLRSAEEIAAVEVVWSDV